MCVCNVAVAIVMHLLGPVGHENNSCSMTAQISSLRLQHIEETCQRSSVSPSRARVTTKRRHFSFSGGNVAQQGIPSIRDLLFFHALAEFWEEELEIRLVRGGNNQPPPVYWIKNFATTLFNFQHKESKKL